MSVRGLFRATIVHFSGLRLACVAQAVRGGSIRDAAARVCAAPLLPRQVAPDLALLAAARGTRVAGWFGGLNSCLVRSLVAGALLSDQDAVWLHIGLRTETVSPLDGHAWISQGGRVLEPGADRFLEVMQVEMRRFPK